MGIAGRERALRLFDWDRTAEQFEQLYLEVGAKVSR
jgi:glycosyltransferase involved in cell wall biosynthesis